MAEAVNLRVEERGGKIKIFGETKAEVDHLLRQATEDVAQKIEDYAKIFAPIGDTKKLKEHPVDVSEAVGQVESRAPLFGGGFAVRGPLGFVPGSGSAGGKMVTHIVIELPEHPAHAVWVHEGTGIFGPHHSPIVSPSGGFMVFRGRIGIVKTKLVRGQVAQPYLTEAYEFVDRTYVPKRVEQLREEIRIALG